MSNLMKDNVVPANTFPPIIDWQFTFLLLHHMPVLSVYVIAVKNGC